MPVTLDAKTLNVLEWSEDNALISSQYDQWPAGTCKRLVRVYGLVRAYQLDCVEQNFAWASSLGNYFKQKASAGTALAFTSDLSVRAVTSTNVYITGVNFTAENVGTQITETCSHFKKRSSRVLFLDNHELLDDHNHLWGSQAPLIFYPLFSKLVRGAKRMQCHYLSSLSRFLNASKQSISPLKRRPASDLANAPFRDSVSESWSGRKFFCKTSFTLE
jgi:hypothetical protein